MREKALNIGDRVRIRTRERELVGVVLGSYIPEVILLKLGSGYNIGIKEKDIIGVSVLEKAGVLQRAKSVLRHDKSLPNVAMIITGGTISSRLDPKTGGVISTDAEEILNISPEVLRVCNIVKIEKPFVKWSENMCFEDWKVLAQTCERFLNDGDIAGVIVTQGTDFLHYSAAALSFFIGNLNKPVAFTYSQRSIDRGSTDASLNLLCAAKYAVSDIAEVAIVGHKSLDDDVCLAMPGTKTRKMHTSRRDAFKVINDKPIAEISEHGLEILREFNARNKGNASLDIRYSDRVALVKVYPGQNPSVLEFYERNGYRGIVLEVSGLGHVPGKDATMCNWLPKIRKLVLKGVVVCAAAQTVYGRLNPNVYSAGRELKKTGIVFLEDMLAETAFVKLAWVLGHKQWARDVSSVKQKMLENFSGELNKRIGYEF